MKLEYLADVERIKIHAENATELRGIKSYLDRHPDGYMFDPLFKMKLWNGKRTQYKKEDDTIPMGLWKEAFKCCEEFGYPFNFVNKQEFPLNRSIKKQEFLDYMQDFFQGYKFQPRDYQLDAAWDILKNRYCNISVATSGGKTLIYSMVLFFLMHKYKNKKFLLVVPSKTLVTQFYDDVLGFNWKEELDINPQEIYAENEKPRTYNKSKPVNLVISTFQSLVYEKKTAIREVHQNGKKIQIELTKEEIAEYKQTKKKIKYKTQTILNYPKDWYKQFWSITCDEGHKSGSESYKKILKYSLKNAYYRWGMSGSFPKDDTYEMMEIMARTGPIVATVKAKKLMDEGYITKVKIKGIIMNHNDWEFAELIEVVSSRDKKAAYDLEVAKIQESDERISVINKIVSQCKSNTLVLFHNTEYGQKMFDFMKEKNPDMDFYFIDGSVKNNATKKNIENNRSFIKSEMEKTDEKVKVLVASFGTLSTGVSINAITNVIFTQSFKKEQVIIQSIGRALRLHANKKMAYVFDLVDRFNHDDYATRTKRKFKNILYTHWEKRCVIYTEEEYPFSEMEINLKPAV